MTQNLPPMTSKWIGILPDPRQASVPSFKVIALELFELCSSDPKNWSQCPHNDLISCLTLNNACTKFQVDSSKMFWVMLPKPNLTFVTSVTLKIKVITPKQLGFLRGLWISYIQSINMIAVTLSLLCGNGCLRADGWTNGQRHNIIHPPCDGCNKSNIWTH